jgi:hypothetical protein
MKKVILFMAGILASMMLNAQSRWSVTPEAGLVVNKENEGTSVTLGFKAGAGVLYQLKEGVGKKPSFGLKSGVYILMQKGGYHPMSWGNISTGGGFSMDYEKTNVESTRYYLQLPVMAHWGFKLCDDVRLKLAVGPYVAVGIGGRTNAYVSSSKYNIDEETGVGQYSNQKLLPFWNQCGSTTVENNMVFNFSCVYFSACRYSGKRSCAFATETVVHRPPIKRVMNSIFLID